MMQVPALRNDATAPETLQTDVADELKEIGSPELALAVNVKVVFAI
jgi:hypothetical protein